MVWGRLRKLRVAKIAVQQMTGFRRRLQVLGGLKRRLFYHSKPPASY